MGMLLVRKNRFNSRFSFKVMAAIMIAVLIPTTFISIFFYLSSASIVKENVRDSSIQITRQAADSLSFVLSTGSDTSDLLYSNESLQRIVMEDRLSEVRYAVKAKNDEDMNAFLNSQVYASSFVRMIYVLKENGDSWGSGTFSKVKLSQYNLNQFASSQKALQNDGAITWQGLQYDLFSGAGESTQLVLPAIRVMKNFKTMENIAYIHVNLDGRSILSKIDQLKLGKTGKFFVVDQDGRIMIDADLDMINKKIKNNELDHYLADPLVSEFEFNQENTTFYGIKQPLVNGWSIVGIVPIKEITGDLQNVQKITLVTSVIFALIAVIFGYFAANAVTQPVANLTNQMKKVGKGEFTPVTFTDSHDEIGLMSRQFNQMIGQVDQLMIQVKEEESQKKEAELRAVKHRIDPHFLFNTLSTIKWLLTFNQKDKAESALSALTKLLEANMGKKGNIISVKEELNIVEKFLVILHIRYEQVFELTVHLDKETESALIPRMLIQPIVENAVFHGFVPRGTGGKIMIKGTAVENGICLHIVDNGMGFQQDVKEKVASSTGIGLNHVYDSVRLYFSSESSVSIESGENGTAVTLILIQKKDGELNV